MSKRFRSNDIRRIEANARFLGLSESQMMESAGRAVADYVTGRFKPCRVAVYCGLGGNGGDGLVAARYLAPRGFDVKVVLVGHPDRISHRSTRENWLLVSRLTTIDTYVATDSLSIPRIEAEIYIDALLGVGVKGEVKPPISEAIRMLNDMRGFKISIDVPSGLDSDTGEILGCAVQADTTITIHGVKPGLEIRPDYTGEIVVVDVGIPYETELYAGPGDLRAIIKPRRVKSHKGDYGRVLVIGGSEVFTGAPTLTALAAFTVGVDLVVVAAPEVAGLVISSYTPNLIVAKLPGSHLKESHLEPIKEWINRCDSIAIGPGLGLDEETIAAVHLTVDEAIEARKPIVIDADALKVLPKDSKLKGLAVLTPHQGEFRILTGVALPDKLRDRGKIVAEWAERFEAVILLKGPIDIVSDGKRVKYNFTGNPAMTVGGTGDILTGLIAGFLAQGSPPFDAGLASAFLNGAAGDLAVESKPYIVATDLLDRIQTVINYVLNDEIELLSSKILSRKDLRRIIKEIEG
ncbi:MAG: NAD(P)H-hydrate dehydratase [Candidatus Bathyarchaeia archaeon]